MTCFECKKKTPHLNTSITGVAINSATFLNNKNSEDSDSDNEEANSDWMAVCKKRKLDNSNENSDQKVLRLKNEGISFAEKEEYWQAIGRWDEALKMLQTTTHQDQSKFFHEMKSQAFMQLHEWGPAIESGKLAAKIDPNWHSAHQTLGRAYLGTGYVVEAVKAFSRARHICPQDEEIKVVDLEWANSLLIHQKLMAAARELNENK